MLKLRVILFIIGNDFIIFTSKILDKAF